jgi:hypothetical protein
LLAVLTAVLVRLAVAAFLLPDFLQPGRDHWEFGYEMGRVARSIAQGHGFGNPYWMPTGPTAELPPAYPYLFAAIFKVLGVDTAASAFALLSLNSIFSALTCAPIFSIAREILGERPAKWAVWAWAFCPYSIYFSSGTMWYHGLVGMLLMWQVWFALRLADSNQKRHWLALGALSAAQALIDPTTLGVLPLLMGWVGYRLQRNGDKWLAPAATSLGIVVLAITPWLVRNYEVFHKPVFLRDGFWLEVYVGNVGNSLHWWNTANHPAGSATERAEYLQLGELGYMDLKKQQAIAYIEAHPATFAWRSLRRIVFMWTGFWSLNREYLQEEPLDRINVFFCFPLTMLMLFALRRLFRAAPDTAFLFALLLLVFPLPYYFAHPDLTYRQPIEPIIILLAAYALAPAREAAFEPAAHSREAEQAYGLRTLEPGSSFFD